MYGILGAMLCILGALSEVFSSLVRAMLCILGALGEVTQIDGEGKQEVMKAFNKVIFVGKRATCREPMAMALLQNEPLWHPVEVESRGLVVLFPEPLNQKAEAVMISRGLNLPDYMSVQLESSDFAEDTLVLTFDQEIRGKVMELEGAQNVYVLTDVTGDELEIMDPYGGDVMSYGLCMETLANTIRKLAEVLNERSFFFDEEVTEEIEKES